MAPAMEPEPWAAVVITINNRNSRKQNEVIFRWSSALAPAPAVVPAVGCLLCVGEPMRLSEQSADSDSFSLPL